METLIRDLRYSVRMLLRNKAFTAVAVLSIALGVGANTAVFSVVNSVLLKSLPFNSPESLVLVWGDSKDSVRLEGHNQVSATDIADIRKQATVFEDVATFAGWYQFCRAKWKPKESRGFKSATASLRSCAAHRFWVACSRPKNRKKEKTSLSCWATRCGRDVLALIQT